MDSSLRHLLVHLDGAPGAEPRLLLARRLAAEHGAAVTAMFATVPAAMMIPYAPDLGGLAVDTLVNLDEQRRIAARQAFDKVLGQQPGVNVRWASISDLGAPLIFARQALFADLVVLGQHDPTHAGLGGAPPQFTETVVSRSGRAALVVPYAGDVPDRFDTVLVAWKDTPEAARAVAAAIPLLQRARRVHVLAWDWHAAEVEGGALDPVQYLRTHGIDSQWHDEGAEPHDVGEQILSRASDMGAQLLVMGASGHSRAREWVLGGATRTMLQSMTLPALMAH